MEAVAPGGGEGAVNDIERVARAMKAKAAVFGVEGVDDVLDTIVADCYLIFTDRVPIEAYE